MSQAISVLYVASEAGPYIRTTDLGETSSSLSLALRECGHDVRLMFPKYGFMSERRNRIHEITRLKEYPVPFAGGKDYASCKSSSLNNARAKVQIYVVGNQTYFGRTGVYTDPHTLKPYPDNGERFTFFCRAVLETCKLLGWKPSIIHCSDWQTGLLPAYAKLIYGEDGFFANTKFVYTVRNLAEQGIFDKEVFDATGLPKTAWSEDGVMSNNKLNCTKAGIRYADVVTLTSPFSAEAARTKEGGYGLQTIFEARRKKKTLFGVLSGIDYDSWDPSKDKHITKKYNALASSDKIDNKRALCSQFGFPFAAEIPLLGFEGPFTEERGVDLLIEAIPELLKANVQMIVHGSGIPKYQDALTKMVKKYPEQFAVETAIDEPLSHLLYAAADMILVPSRVATAGTAHLCAMRYGAIPIVRGIGAFLDTVIEPGTIKNQPGTGFHFAKETSADFVKAVKRGLDLWKDHEAWKKLVDNVMRIDHSWRASAEKYSVLYRNAIKKD